MCSDKKFLKLGMCAVTQEEHGVTIHNFLAKGQSLRLVRAANRVRLILGLGLEIEFEDC
jgi:hypothetical protein